LTEEEISFGLLASTGAAAVLREKPVLRQEQFMVICIFYTELSGVMTNILMIPLIRTVNYGAETVLVSTLF
jgi:hypothetical protein